MKNWTFLFIICATLLACQRKAIAISNTVSEKPKKENTGDSIVLSVSSGETLFINRCGRCHALKNTERFTVEEWNNILPVMTRKARLTETEVKNVTAYVLAHAKK